MSHLTITADNFASEVLASTQTVLLDFWAEWCGPCRMLSPIIDAIADSRSDIKVGKVNVDDEVRLAAQFGIESIPTLLVFKGGKLVNRSVGYQPRESIEALL